MRPLEWSLPEIARAEPEAGDVRVLQRLPRGHTDRLVDTEPADNWLLDRRTTHRMAGAGIILLRSLCRPQEAGSSAELSMRKDPLFVSSRHRPSDLYLRGERYQATRGLCGTRHQERLNGDSYPQFANKMPTMCRTFRASKTVSGARCSGIVVGGRRMSGGCALRVDGSQPL
jgi:hypothetical protein